MLLERHRRALVISVAMLVAAVGLLFAVGRHPPESAPLATIEAIGDFDQRVWTWFDGRRGDPLGVFHLLNLLGSGFVTIPLRIGVTSWLGWRRRWVAFSAFVLTWLTSEVTLTALKVYFHRGRPPGRVVDVVGFSFPSGHAVAGAAVAVSLVLCLMHAGPTRRRLEWVAVGFAFIMAFSRVYLAAHWFSDVVAGTFLGAGIAIFWGAAVMGALDMARARGLAVPVEPAQDTSPGADEVGSKAG